MNARRALTVVLGVIAAAAAPAAVLTPAAVAESTQTAESAAYGLDWIGRVPDSAFGDPATRPVICEVDTGVAVTPDTPETSSAGPIVARLSVYSDDPVGGEKTAMTHGTRMAAAIAAPRNNWGIVGIYPGARIVSVKASTTGLLDSAAVTRGITLCRQWALTNNVKVAAVLLALGSPSADPSQGARMNEYVAQLNADGASVVAAAGNEAGQGTQWPASTPGAIAVGAGTAAGGSWCPFASHDVLTTIVAPGCDVTAAADDGSEATWPEGGSSNAAAVTAGLVAALRALRPDATRQNVEGWLSAGNTVLDGAHQLDGRAIAAAAGVGGLVTPTPTVQQFPTPAPTAAIATLPAPKHVRAKISKRTLRVSVAKTIKGQTLQVAVRSGSKWLRGAASRSAVVKQVRSLPARVWVRWTAPGAASPWTLMKRPTNHASARLWRAAKSHKPVPPR